MKKYKSILAVLCIAILVLGTQSCKKDVEDNDPSADGFTSLNVPDGFTWSTSNYLDISLMFVDQNQNPVSVEFDIYSEYPGGAKYLSGASGSDGAFNRRYKISSHRELFMVVLPNQNPVIVNFENAIINDLNAKQAKQTIVVENPVLKNGNAETYQYYPAEGLFGTIGFEDNWPWKADYDFNDVLFDYNVMATFDESDMVTKIDMILYLRASGASFDNGFGISFKHVWSWDGPYVDIATVTVVASDENGAVLSDNVIAPEATNYPSYILIPNVETYQPTYNTFPEQLFKYPIRFDVEIVLNTPAEDWEEIDLPLNNPFIIVDQERGREVHLPWYVPTSLADPDYVGMAADASDPTAFDPSNFKAGNMMGYYTYMTEDGYPWGIDVYFDEEGDELYRYPIEYTDISQAYAPAFQGWVENGTPYEWYLPEYRMIGRVFEEIPDPPYPESE